MYPLDRRTVALRIYEKLGSLRKTSELVGCCHSTVSRWINNPERKQYQKDTTKTYKSETIIDVVKNTIKENPTVSLTTLKIFIKNSIDIDVSKELIRKTIQNNGFVKKKAYFYGEAKNQTELTQTFITKRNQNVNEQRRFIFVDESSYGRNGIETKGYVEKGSKLFIKKPSIIPVNKSLLCAIDGSNIVGRSIKQGSFKKKHSWSLFSH